MEKLSFKNTNNKSFNEIKKYCEDKLNQKIDDFQVMDAYNYLTEKELCNNCNSLINCKQRVKGFYPDRLFDDNFELGYKKCAFKQQFDRNSQIKENFEIMNMPIKLKEATLDDFKITSDSRRKLLCKASEILSSYPNCKGIYLHGLNSAGKSYFTAALLNELAKRDVKSIMLYYPELLRSVRNQYNMINNEVMEKLLNIDVLVLDDLGSENNTVFSRDEILSPILQHRLLSNKLTIITSNYSLKNLREHLSRVSGYNKSDSTFEDVKSLRILRRIIDLTDEFVLNEVYNK